MYFFKIRNGFLGHCEQYPASSINTFKKIICDRPHSNHEVIMVRRVDGNVYYVYLCPLNKKDIFGIGIVSDCYCTDYEFLVFSFRAIVEDVIKEKVIITKIGNSYAFKPHSLLDEHVIIDIFLRNNSFHIDGAKINSVNLAVSKSDKVQCVFKERGSAWIVEQLKQGYHKIDIYFSDNRKFSKKKSVISGFSWGWKTWTLFGFLMAIILLTACLIFSNPILRTQFLYALEIFIP